MEKLAFSVAESAEILGCSENHVYRMVDAGHLARIPHMGRRVLIARIELERFTAQGRLQDVAS
jgi:excisionase family DNA binding protein